ncbi:hypothetical protein [Zavarzinella formosa]|uniref:hypothetical protein n=1 Tax=Zavarzinella formosa TaxID=360055 RepID=UPI0002FAA837|nr:hypothetical protein [Zavarzinella formosa]
MMSDHIRRACPECGKECQFEEGLARDIGVCWDCGAEFLIGSAGKGPPPLPGKSPPPLPVKSPPPLPGQSPPPLGDAGQRVRGPAILDAMAVWFERKEFQIEGQWRNPNSMKEVLVGKAAAFAAKRLAIAMIGHSVPGLGISISGGASEKKVIAAMEPLIELTDFVAVQFCSLFSTSKANRIVAVILGDDTRPEEITPRFEKLMAAAKPVAKLGLRTHGQHIGMAVYPLIVHTRSDRFRKDADSILRQGWSIWRWSNIHLRAAVIDAEAPRIEWAKNPGLGHGGSLFDIKPPFSDTDVAEMLRPSSPS